MVVREDSSEADGERAMSGARSHWEAHVGIPKPSAVPYFLIHGVGPYKSSRVGSWADLLLEVPYFLRDGDPMPPLTVVSTLIASGGDYAGMSGGCEWPRHELSRAEFDDITDQLAPTQRFLPIDAPEWVVEQSDFHTWTIAARNSCSREAAMAWQDALAAAGGGEPFARLHAEKAAWFARYDADHAR